MAKVRIFATDEEGVRKEVGDYLYFFEEQGIHDLGGEDQYGRKYKIEIEIDDVLVEITDYTKCRW